MVTTDRVDVMIEPDFLRFDTLSLQGAIHALRAAAEQAAEQAAAANASAVASKAEREPKDKAKAAFAEAVATIKEGVARAWARAAASRLGRGRRPRGDSSGAWCAPAHLNLPSDVGPG